MTCPSTVSSYKGLTNVTEELLCSYAFFSSDLSTDIASVLSSKYIYI